jgi:hypothetical protein
MSRARCSDVAASDKARASDLSLCTVLSGFINRSAIAPTSSLLSNIGRRLCTKGAYSDGRIG